MGMTVGHNYLAHMHLHLGPSGDQHDLGGCRRGAGLVYSWLSPTKAQTGVIFRHNLLCSRSSPWREACVKQDDLTHGHPHQNPNDPCLPLLASHFPHHALSLWRPVFHCSYRLSLGLYLMFLASCPRCPPSFMTDSTAGPPANRPFID